MHNEITNPRSLSARYHVNTNTHDVTLPYIKTRKSKSKARKNKHNLILIKINISFYKVGFN